MKKPFSLHRNTEENPYCGLGVCGENRWKFVMKINGSKVIRDHNNQVQEPIAWRLHLLPYKPYKTTFARIFLFLETAGGS